MTVTCIRLSASSPSVPWSQTIDKGPLGGGGGKRYRRCRCSLSWHGGQDPDSGEEERTSQGPLSKGLLLFCLFRFKETCRKQGRGGWRCRIERGKGWRIVRAFGGGFTDCVTFDTSFHGHLQVFKLYSSVYLLRGKRSIQINSFKTLANAGKGLMTA